MAMLVREGAAALRGLGVSERSALEAKLLVAHRLGGLQAKLSAKPALFSWEFDLGFHLCVPYPRTIYDYGWPHKRQLQDSTKFIKEGDEHHVKPTQDPTPSDEGRHLENEISAGKLDGCDSEDENDSSKKKKRAAHSAPSERCSGKVPKFACYDVRADQVIDPYSITECLRILKTMGDIPYPIVMKATAKFKSPAERETFVGLTEDWKREWVKDLENDTYI
ncbi:hypothetical protein SLEP1_g34142 [Rubroshorea leprosula]|uniref:Uncharacterized protein n=1 Tax=Rubroshorea leprosula TaxID=152421 RepID=A0AAV5KIV9_9ROSI|nr:hypothetical protein SLEP1_g34142 [Rubroshorea leprosula]